jgi:hypothetical protein
MCVSACVCESACQCVREYVRELVCMWTVLNVCACVRDCVCSIYSMYVCACVSLSLALYSHKKVSKLSFTRVADL